MEPRVEKVIFFYLDFDLLVLDATGKDKTS
jgi:hypothetical protein